MRFPFITLAGLVALASLVLTACEPKQPQAGGMMPQGPVEVETVILNHQPVTLTRELTGRTRAFLIAEVRPQVSGLIEERLFTEGALVEEDQPLYQLDNALYLAEVNSAKASLQRAQAGLNAAQRNANRAESLRKTGAISQQAYDDAITGLEEAEASLAVAQATLASRQVNLNNARITAPISGKISISEVTRGALVTANQPQPLTTIQQLNPIYVDVTQSSTEWLRLQRQLETGALKISDDLSVQLTLEDGSDYPHKGKMTLADVSVNETTGSFVLRIEVPNPDQRLLPGMYVKALMNLGKREQGLLVPQRAVGRDLRGNTFVMLVNKNNEIENRPVVVNQTLGDQWLVDSGLKVGDQVVVAGLQKIRPGVKVTSVPAQER